MKSFMSSILARETTLNQTPKGDKSRANIMACKCKGEGSNDANVASLKNFFTPESVAVIGASSEPGKVGYDILFNLIDAKFQGKIYPVNPKAPEILGIPAFKSISEIPGNVDLAVIVIPSKFIPGVINECGEKGVKNVVVISAGFKEMGSEGKALEVQLMENAKKYGIRIIGPNCLGIISTACGLNASFAPVTPKNGKIGLLSQSGALATAILDWSSKNGIGYNKFFTFGNQADVGTNDLLRAWKDDDDIKVIVAYVEDVKDGVAFMDIAKQVTAVKPFVLVKAGGTAAGAKAAASHTGSLAGADRAYDAAFNQTGVLRAKSVQELFDMAIAFTNSPMPKGSRIGIVTNAGGPGILCTDAVERAGMSLASLSEETVTKLKSKLPAAANFHNPVDVLGDAKAELYDFAIETVLADDGVDGVIVLVTPQTSTEITETADVVVKYNNSAEKPIFASFIGGTLMAKGIDILRSNEVPTYPFPERAVLAFKALVDYAKWRNTANDCPKVYNVDRSVVTAAFAKTRAEGRTTLNEIECADILEAYGFKLPASKLCTSADDVATFSNSIGYPVVMKIASPDILHKSDCGGVKVGLKNEAEIRAAYEDMMTSVKAKMPNANIWGVNIQQMVVEGKQTILGVSKDAQFGPMIMFGLGGIYVEVLKDVTFRIAPVNEREVREMVKEIRSYKLLTGVRGEKSVDMDAIVDAIMRLSQLVTDFPEIDEMDINPLIAMPGDGGVIAIDSRISLKI